MGIQLTGLGETSEERSLRLRQATIKRIRILVIVCVISIGARIFIKNPPPPKPRDVSKVAIRYTPGMLDNMSASTLKRMDPILLARLQKADQDARRARMIQSQNLVQSNYRPAEVPLTNKAEEEAYKQLEFIYAKKRETQIHEKEKREARDLTKTMLVQFRSGGYLKAEKASHVQQSCEIQVDRTMMATLPKKLVASVSDNAVTWKAPIPQGFVQLKPAKGITITVLKQSAERITIKKSPYDET